MNQLLLMYTHKYILLLEELIMHTAKVFKNGNSQAVRLPKEFAVDDSELFIQKIGSSIILTSKKDPWNSFKNSLEMFSDDVFSEGREQPEQQEREEF